MERDFYDEMDPVYIVARNHDERNRGMLAASPTTGPYMLKNTFPQLLCGDAAPQDQNIWELSRFAVQPSNSTEHTQAVLNSLTFDMIRSVYDFFAQQLNIQRYITRYQCRSGTAFETNRVTYLSFRRTQSHSMSARSLRWPATWTLTTNFAMSFTSNCVPSMLDKASRHENPSGRRRSRSRGPGSGAGACQRSRDHPLRGCCPCDHRFAQKRI